MTILNTYGDSYVATSGTHGADIASQRCDELDNAAIDFSKNISTPLILDVGCGRGAQSIRFAQYGAKVIAVDIVDFKEHIQHSAAELSLPSHLIDFNHTDIESFLKNSPYLFDVIYSQRFLHYLHPKKARIVATSLYDALKSGGALFISASGMGSELSNGYQGITKDCKERFDYLSKDMQEKHGIKEPVCLYSPEEFKALFEEAGFKPKKIWESSFGNVKAMFLKPQKNE